VSCGFPEEGATDWMSYRFGDVEIDTEAFRVVRAGESIRLEPKALELLVYLATHSGRLVTKGEIQQAIWKDTFVTESALTRLVAQIRRGLGDDAREARYIETVPTRGYRFIARLEEGGSEDPVPLEHDHPPARSPRRLGPGVGVLAALVLVGLVAGSREARRRAPAAGPRLTAPRTIERQISTGASLNLYPRFSPEGSSIAYSTLRGGSLEIVLRALAPGASEVAITGDGQQNIQPAFSPDGRLIAYHSVARGGIWLVPALGGLPRRLTRFGSSPAFSPDGRQIAFQGQSWVAAGQTLWPASEGSTIWAVSSAGGEPRPLTTIEKVGPGGQGSPTWSPDGKLLAFLAGTRVFILRLDDGTLRATSGYRQVQGIAWEKGGRSQVWTGSQSDNWCVWRVRVAPETGEPMGAPQVLASGGEAASAWSQPEPSPDGRSIAYVTFRTRYEILVQGVTPGGRPRSQAAPLVTSVGGRKVPLGFSPDGRRFAFTTLRPGAGRSVWVSDLASGEVKLVAEGQKLQASRAWFPDARRLGYLAPGEGGLSFWSVDVETGDTREVRRLDAPVWWAPRLSPDGGSLLFHGALQGRLNVWRTEIDGGAARPITNDPEGTGWAVWSPDGRQIALEIVRGGDTRVGLMAASGGAVREIVSTPGQNWPYSFSPDGRRVALAGQRRGIWNVYTAPVVGGTEQPVTSYDSPAVYVRYPDWSPLGDRIAYEYALSASTVWVADLSPMEP
jgi:Tol biopolymer transport system component/DNA-binding winged helix-turn-helix (wHTH) protein